MNKSVLERLEPITEEERRILGGNTDIDRKIYMCGNPNVINAKKLLGTDRIITVRTHTRFIHFPEHTHDYVEVIYMCKGETTHIVNGDRVELSQGSLLFLAQNTTHEVLAADKDDIAVNFIISPVFFDTVLDMLGEEESPLRRFVVKCLKNGGESGGYLYFEVADVLPIQNLTENLIWSLLSEDGSRRGINRITMGLLFLQLLNYTDRLVHKDREEESIIYVLEYIEEHYCDGELSEIAEILHYDISWLSREIKARTGKTYTELVLDKRLSRAAYFLCNTPMGVSEIAERVGYTNKSFFHKIFRQRYGLTPAKYRKMKG